MRRCSAAAETVETVPNKTILTPVAARRARSGTFSRAACHKFKTTLIVHEMSFRLHFADQHTQNQQCSFCLAPIEIGALAFSTHITWKHMRCIGSLDAIEMRDILLSSGLLRAACDSICSDGNGGCSVHAAHKAAVALSAELDDDERDDRELAGIEHMSYVEIQRLLAFLDCTCCGVEPRPAAPFRVARAADASSRVSTFGDSRASAGSSSNASSSHHDAVANASTNCISHELRKHSGSRNNSDSSSSSTESKNKQLQQQPLLSISSAASELVLAASYCSVASAHTTSGSTIRTDHAVTTSVAATGARRDRPPQAVLLAAAATSLQQ
jgi:hypothetical protein